MNFLERAVDHLVEQIANNQHKEYPLSDVANLDYGYELTRLFANRDDDKHWMTDDERLLRLADLQMKCEKRVREFVIEQLSAEARELAAELERDAREPA